MSGDVDWISFTKQLARAMKAEARVKELEVALEKALRADHHEFGQWCGVEWHEYGDRVLEKKEAEP